MKQFSLSSFIPASTNEWKSKFDWFVMESSHRIHLTYEMELTITLNGSGWHGLIISRPQSNPTNKRWTIFTFMGELPKIMTIELKIDDKVSINRTRFAYTPYETERTHEKNAQKFRWNIKCKAKASHWLPFLLPIRYWAAQQWNKLMRKGRNERVL